MKHLPNLLTLANLFFGCIAIAFILNAQPFKANFNNGQEYWVYGTEQMYMGSFFILLAAVCDMLDGAVARALKVFSPIGKDLDSLADMVTFGVAPSMILFKMLWSAYMSSPSAFDAPMLAMTPAFLVACFAALRLAKFNVTANTQKWAFKGMPTPTVGLFVASFPVINVTNPYHLGERMQSTWFIYLVIAVLCWLMVSGVRFFKFMPARWQPAYFWPQALLVLIALAGYPILHFGIVPVLFLLYIILSFVYKYPDIETSAAN